MKKLIESRIENMSTRDVFFFRVRCDACGDTVESKPARFSKASATPETAEKEVVYEALYQQELDAARKRACSELAAHMNCCPVCKRVVCNSCFLICEDLDMCADCAAKLNEKGVPVNAGTSG